MNARLLCASLLLAAVVASFACGQSEPVPLDDPPIADYSQWKLALGEGELAQPVAIEALPDFRVEIVRQAAAGEGSWISLAFDAAGRLLVGREDKGILRFTFDDFATEVTEVETIDDTLLEPRGLLLAHDSLYVTANNAKGIYRLQDTTGDGKYDKVERLLELAGGVGHGRNGMALGPDGKIYVALGNNVKLPKEASSDSPYRNGQLDRLLPNPWNEFLFDSDVTPPAGFIARFDADGGNFEIVAGGFRNPYDLAFNAAGALFTYDADMEWDLGAPWYRPTTVMQVVPGGEYGWRQGTSVWPDFFPDALPRVVDVGLGSPTGIAFGHEARFPVRYRRALFLLDWAYGRILAVHLTPTGESYRGQVETFLKGKPLNVTDLAIGPDGAMYFTVGGRGTRSALYRVRYKGDERADELDPRHPEEIMRMAREKMLETLRRRDESPFKISPIWEMGLRDPFLRHQARIATEREPLETWWKMALDDGHSRRAPWMLLALARSDEPMLRSEVLERITYWLGEKMEPQDRLAALRAAQLALIRLGEATGRERRLLREAIEARYPAPSFAENYLAAELLVALDSSVVADRTLPLIPKLERPSDRLALVFILRHAKQGWSLEARRQYLALLKEAESYPGAHYMPRFITYIRTDALASFSPEEREALADEISQLGRLPEEASAPAEPRPEVQKWTLETLAAELAKIDRAPDRERGLAMYAAAQCNRCHRLADRGVPFGPDLTHVGSRFSRRDLLDAIVHPSRVIDDKYRTLALETEDGQAASGFLVGGDAESFYIAADPLDPTVFRRIERAKISERRTSPLSPMPEGLLNTLTADEIYDLLGLLEGR
jgi:putative heme-binding domain-containing protein